MVQHGNYPRNVRQQWVILNPGKKRKMAVTQTMCDPELAEIRDKIDEWFQQTLGRIEHGGEKEGKNRCGAEAPPV